MKSAVHSKQLLSVAEDLYYTPKQIEEILMNLREYFNKSFVVEDNFGGLLNYEALYTLDEEVELLLNDQNEYNNMAKALNPYGDGNTSKLILERIKELTA